LKHTLRSVPLASVWPIRLGTLYITMSKGQWDETLAAAYDDGWVLIVVDDDEKPVAAFRRPADA